MAPLPQDVGPQGVGLDVAVHVGAGTTSTHTTLPLGLRDAGHPSAGGRSAEPVSRIAADSSPLEEAETRPYDCDPGVGNRGLANLFHVGEFVWIERFQHRAAVVDAFAAGQAGHGHATDGQIGERRPLHLRGLAAVRIRPSYAAGGVRDLRSTTCPSIADAGAACQFDPVRSEPHTLVILASPRWISCLVNRSPVQRCGDQSLGEYQPD